MLATYLDGGRTSSDYIDQRYVIFFAGMLTPMFLKFLRASQSSKSKLFVYTISFEAITGGIFHPNVFFWEVGFSNIKFIGLISIFLPQSSSAGHRISSRGPQVTYL